MIRHALVLALLGMAGLAVAQSQEMNDPDLVGLKPGMRKEEALAALKERFPHARLTATKREVVQGGYSLYYDAQVKVEVEKDRLKPGTVQDTIFFSLLPNNELIAIRRVLRYAPNGQKNFDLQGALKTKYGMPVYFVYDDSTRFADQSMWSNTMLPGLTLVGTKYVQGGNVSSSDFGTTTPYPYCWSEMMGYASEQYNPASLYAGLTDRGGVALNRAKQWKACGKALWVASDHEHRLTYNATQTEMLLVDLGRAAERVLAMPQMLKDQPEAVPLKQVQTPAPQGPVPQL